MKIESDSFSLVQSFILHPGKCICGIVRIYNIDIDIDIDEHHLFSFYYSTRHYIYDIELYYTTLLYMIFSFIFFFIILLYFIFHYYMLFVCIILCRFILDICCMILYCVV